MQQIKNISEMAGKQITDCFSGGRETEYLFIKFTDQTFVVLEGRILGNHGDSAVEVVTQDFSDFSEDWVEHKDYNEAKVRLGLKTEQELIRFNQELEAKKNENFLRGKGFFFES